MKLRLPDHYENNNPKIISRVRNDLRDNKNFHYLFLGDTGVGKTYLAEIIMDLFSKEVQEYRMLTEFRKVDSRTVYGDYLEQIKNKWNSKQRVTDILKCKNVVLDDVGDEKPDTEQSRAFIANILTDRYDYIKSGKGKRTIYTSNFDIKQLGERYGYRVVDRMYQFFTIMCFKSGSFREKNLDIIV